MNTARMQSVWALAALVLSALGAAGGVAGAAGADPIEGVWKTKPDDSGNYGHVKIAPCGPAFCGELITAFDGWDKQIDSPDLGKLIVWDMMAYPEGRYDDGKVWAPDRNKTFESELTLSGDRLKVRGCMFGICRDGGTWLRIDPATGG